MLLTKNMRLPRSTPVNVSIHLKVCTADPFNGGCIANDLLEIIARVRFVN